MYNFKITLRAKVTVTNFVELTLKFDFKLKEAVMMSP